MIACGTKRGSILIYQLSTGKLLAEVENAHYLSISDLDVSNASGSLDSSQGYASGDLILTGGKDSKVKVFILAQLLATDKTEDVKCFAEFGDHSAEVTQVRFSFAASQQRAFSCSLDKTFKVYDLPSKTVLKTIQV